LTTGEGLLRGFKVFAKQHGFAPAGGQHIQIAHAKSRGVEPVDGVGVAEEDVLPGFVQAL
jgi:hypothetical protein